MKWSTTASYALAAGVVLALAGLAARDRGQTAEQFLASIEKRHTAGRMRLDQYLRELALAQEQAEHEGQPELAQRVQLQRGHVLLDLGSFADARGVLAAVAAEGGAHRDLELLRIELERRAGDAAAGLELAHAWLETHPDDARALELAGRLQRMQAEAQRDEALQMCEKELASADARRAQSCVRELALRHPADLRRVALARDLRAVFGTLLEPTAERVLVLCDSAAGKAAAAREALGRSLELGFDVEALTQLAEMLEQSGQAEEALDLFTAASKLPAMLDNEHATTFLMHALVERRRWRHATLVATAWLDKHKGSPEFLLDACRACYEAIDSKEATGRLYGLSGLLWQVVTAEMGVTPSFYMGEAFYVLKNRAMFEQAYLHLSTFALNPGPEPVPGARAIAFRHLAECCRALGRVDEERQMLESAVELDARNGEAWLRLAELQLAAPRGGFREPDLRWARGMALLPARQAELLPRWLEIGAGELRALGLEPQILEKNIQSGLAVRPSNGAAPFELYTLAAAYSRAGRSYDAQALLQDLDKMVPDFLPAIDLRIDMARAHNRPRELVEAFLARLEVAGYDERTRELRAALPEGALSPVDLRRIVRADPGTSGRLALARSLAARGDPRSALGFLLEIPAERLRPAEQALTARMELESGRPDAAFERAGALGEDLGRTPGALETWVEAGLRAGQVEKLREELPQRIAPLELDATRFLALSDRLLASGEARLARAILVQLDKAPKRPRGGDVLWRLSACALALASESGADFERGIERASAFDTRGEVELLTLLALPPAAGPDRLQAAVQALRKAGWNPSPLGAAALALLAGDTAGLRAALDAAREQDAHDPLPALLEQAAGAPAKDSAEARWLAAAGTRGLAELVLELERPALGACAHLRLAAIDAAASPSWTAWFRARLHRNAGERESEERVLRALLEQDPHFAAAWDRLIELHTSATDEGDLDLHVARAAALGDSFVSPAERDWNRSRQLEREGALAAALDAARAAASLAVQDGPIQLHLGRLALRTGDLPLALSAFRRALPLLPAASAARARADYVELLARAREAEPPLLDAEAQRADLEQLAVQAPDDPLVLLAQARNDLETSATDPAFGAQRAYERLDHFREQHAKRSFEELAAGSTESWTRFLLELDPARARAFLDAELDRDPGLLQAWALLPRCSAAMGRDAQAVTELTFVEQLAPRADVLSEYMRVRARSDWTPEGVAQISERLRSIAPAAGSAPAELALELRAYLSLGPRGVPMLLELGAQLTPERLEPQPSALRAEVYWMQSIALLARDQGDDRAQARMRAAALDTLVRDPARRPLVAALRGLAQVEAPATAELHPR